MVNIVAVSVFLVAAVWVVNPYGNIPLSPSLDRAPIATNQRYSYPAIARDEAFDSVVIGTSTSRLLRPEVLNTTLGARFANLSMNSGTAYEQSRIGELFARHHPRQKALIVGLDAVWCQIGDAKKYTIRRFPEWLYDASPWNDFHNMAEFRTLYDLVRQASHLLGLRSERYRRDGYANFLPPVEKYDLARARKKIYGASGSATYKTEARSANPRQFDRSGWQFGSHRLLEKMLERLPAYTNKILVFVPYHRNWQSAPSTEKGAQWDECKKRVSDIASRYPNTILLDFMIDSPITARDENYWDPRHYSNEVADQFATLIAKGAHGEPAPNGEYVVLSR